MREYRECIKMSKDANKICKDANKIYENINQIYEYAKDAYAVYGVDTENVLKEMNDIHISLHCWQGDDVAGFEKDTGSVSGGGIMATGNYPGRARNGEELRQDIKKALSLIPGGHRINLHAIYAETGDKYVDRDQLDVEHFRGWVDWAKREGIGIDFNPTFFLTRWLILVLPYPVKTKKYVLSGYAMGKNAERLQPK